MYLGSDVMKNGPVISNISLINKALLELGSPLHYKLFVDYLRINWNLGKGIKEKEAIDILNIALNAGFYYEEVEEQHYCRKQLHSSNLDKLYQELKDTKVPIKQNQKKPLYNLRDVNIDVRFTVMVTEVNDTYILLSEWNLLNDLGLRLFIREHLHNIPIFEAVSMIKRYYDITDSYALFFPHFDHRFIVSRNGKVSLKSYDESQIQIYSNEVTNFIREEVARYTPKLLMYLKNRYGEEIKIRTLVNEVFGIEAHTPKFTAYFAAVKDHLITYAYIRITQNGDSVVFLEKEEVTITEKLSLQGSTDNILLGRKIDDLSRSDVLLEEPQKKVDSNKESQSRTSLIYTIRYYDRVQETLTAHYFKDWLFKNELHIELLHDNENITLIFFYDAENNVLYGTHLENMMSDYELIPGQKLFFQLDDKNKLTLKLGNVTEADLKEQERYIDIARLAEENKLTSKSLLQIVTEILIYHPSGLHVSEIIRLVKKEAPYAESSITATLSSQDFYEKVPGQIGFWVFNPSKWKRKKVEKGREESYKPIKTTLNKHRKQKVLTSLNHCKILAKNARDNPSRLTNEMFMLMDKDIFINRAWDIYANNVYNIAKRFSSPEIPLEDYFQEAYFALLKAYENYNPNFKRSFYNYFKRYLSTRLKRYQQNRKNLIRIPVHRLEVLEKYDKEIELELLLKGDISILDELETDYTVWKTNFLSFEELYLYEGYLEDTDDIVRARLYSYFSKQSDYDSQFEFHYKSLSFGMLEPDCSSIHEMIFEEVYNLIEPDFYQDLWEYVDEKAKSIRPSDVLKLRFGFNKGDFDYTLEQVGKVYGVTRERIRQIEGKGLKRAREFLSVKGYKQEHFEK